MYKLVISDDEGKTTVVPLIRDVVSIGRKEGNTIRLTERNVSRYHARVIRQEDAFLIEDLGSLVGTKVNSELLKSESAAVSIGDKISIGDYSLSIRTDVSSDVPLGRQMGPGDEAGIGRVTPHARLVMLTDPEPGREIELTADLYVLGRSEEANCRVQDSSISRAHARIDLDAGEWTISDLDSINGITINGIKKDDYVLKAGDIVQLGSVQFRFVAPGEPFEFDPGASGAMTGAPVPLEKKSSHKILYVLGFLGAAAAIAIFAAITILGQTDESDDPGDGTETSTEPDTFESLMERGKDKIQAEEWAEAARLFALALQKEPTNQTAREMKRLAILEADAQKSFTSGLAAGEAKNWQKAVLHFGEIPRSSHYYDIEQLRVFSGKLCSELLENAQAAATRGDIQTARQLLGEIGGIPEVPPNCRNKKEQVHQTLGSFGRPDAGSGAVGDTEEETEDSLKKRRLRGTRKVAPTKKGAAPTGFASLANPYESAGGKSADGAGSRDPLSEAHAAVRAGDNQRAISILEKGGNSRRVLLLLSRLYGKAGNRAGYEAVARKFIRLYPEDPRSEQFKKHLAR